MAPGFDANSEKKLKSCKANIYFYVPSVGRGKTVCFLATPT